MSGRWPGVSPDFLAALTRGGNGPIPDETMTLGPAWCRWIEANCVMGEGDRAGETVRLSPHQVPLIWKIAEINPDGRLRFNLILYSVGKGSGKSPLGGWLGSVALAGPAVTCPGCAACVRGFRPDGTPHAVRRRSPDVLVMASTYDQADLIMDEIRVTFHDGPLAPFAEANKGLVNLLGGERGRARRIPATTKKADGSKATTLIVDECHEFDTPGREAAYDVATAGTAKRQDGQTFVLSTAGWDMSTLFGRLSARGERGDFASNELYVRLAGAESLDPTDDVDIAAGILAANPLAADGAVTLAPLVGKFLAMPPERAKRYYWNQWVRTDAAWLPAGAWDACQARGDEWIFDPSLPTWLGADMAIARDSAAVVMLQRRPDGRLQASSRIWLPDGERIRQDECDDYIRAVGESHNLLWVAADEAWWASLADLESEGLPIFRMPQKGRNMIIAYSRTYRIIVDQILMHDGAPDFSDQIASAAPSSSDRGWTLKKGKGHRRIDSCPALAGAIFASTIPEREETPAPQPMWVI